MEDLVSPGPARAPRVTVVMPVYNSPRARFYRSFDALLAQSFGDFEIILSDNGSNDEAQALYEEAARRDDRVRTLRHAHNYGSAFNFTYSLALGRGDYFMWAADDDIRAPDSLRRTVDLLDRHPDAVAAGTGVVLVDNDGKRLDAVRFDPSFALPRPSQRVPVRGRMTPGDYMDVYALHRRAALARTHLSLPIHGADVLLVRELLLQGPIVRAEEELLFYRQPAAYSMDSLARAVLGGQARPVLFRYAQQHLALQMLVAAATNDVAIDPAERRACVALLLASLVRHGWLTDEPYARRRERATEVRRAGDRALAEGDFLGAARSFAGAFALAPTRALDAGAWARIAGRIKRKGSEP
jgi:hypothetical protein